MAKFKEKVQNIFSGLTPMNFVFALLGGVLLGFTIRNIHSISPVTEGGMLGLSLLIDHWLHISPSITTPILSVFCYMLAYRALGKNFIIYSAVAVLSFSGSLALFEQFPPIAPEIANNLLLSSILGGIGVGVSCGLCVVADSAPTADDALAIALSKKTRMPITLIYLISDLTVLGFSLTYIPLKQIAFSLLTVCISGAIIGAIEKIAKLIKEKKESKLTLIEQ